ncbi:hypothetical protein GCM10023091_12000 [Ravibacter arvi]|uniref:D-alanine--D-alanine ligase n=1 Tax=Ravibacter arvi TaxID=2051041 RepID=A0ABP8LU49_9BACT
MIRVGIFFGGPSREREISFAGGKTAFEHLDKQLFLPVPVFVDGFGRFILLKEAHMYAADIRSVFSADAPGRASRLYIDSYPGKKNEPVSPEIGQVIGPERFTDYFDFVFLAMHGPDCEDGAIQGLLEWFRIPYSGPGLLGSSIGINKILQNKMLATVVGQQKATASIAFDEWQKENGPSAVFERIKSQLGLPVVIKAPHQGSSIGVAIVKEDDLEKFKAGVNQCFFTATVPGAVWRQKSLAEKQLWADSQADLESGIGYPLFVEDRPVSNPDELIGEIDSCIGEGAEEVLLLSVDFEPEVLCEEFVEGQEFSCGCIQLDNGRHVALPPTEVIKVDEVFDFNSKYKPGGTRKRIPVKTSLDRNLKIQDYVVKAAESLDMAVCVRIDGFLTADGEVVLHDPNTVPGMSPSSLIFKQMAEIGLNITQSLTYLIRQSMAARIGSAKDTVRVREMLSGLDNAILKGHGKEKPCRSIWIEPDQEAYQSAKKWYSKISGAGEFEGRVLLKRGDGSLVKLPVQLLFKDFIADVLSALDTETDPLILHTRKVCGEITRRYAGKEDFDPVVFHELPADTFEVEH